MISLRNFNSILRSGRPAKYIYCCLDFTELLSADAVFVSVGVISRKKATCDNRLSFLPMLRLTPCSLMNEKIKNDENFFSVGSFLNVMGKKIANGKNENVYKKWGAFYVEFISTPRFSLVSNLSFVFLGGVARKFQPRLCPKLLFLSFLGPFFSKKAPLNFFYYLNALSFHSHYQCFFPPFYPLPFASFQRG